MSNTPKLDGWAPVDAIVSDGKPGLLWMDVQGVKFSEPFFQQTVERLRQESPPRRELFAEFDSVLQFGKTVAGLKPAGFIFHSSRCGSTLLANALKCLSGSIVISEANAIDKLLARFITDAESDQRKQVLYSVILRSVVNALGQQHCGTEQKLFVKFSCCSTAKLDQVQMIWPDVPWIFLYRDPVETLVSNLKTKPAWLLDPDRRVLASIIGVKSEQVEAMSDEELCARSIGRFYGFAEELANERSLLLNYSQLTGPTVSRLLQFFSVIPTNEELEAIERITRLYSKDINISRTFTEDSDRKRQMASTLVTEAAKTWASDSYRRLENRRPIKQRD